MTDGILLSVLYQYFLVSRAEHITGSIITELTLVITNKYNNNNNLEDICLNNYPQSLSSFSYCWQTWLNPKHRLGRNYYIKFFMLWLQHKLQGMLSINFLTCRQLSLRRIGYASETVQMTTYRKKEWVIIIAHAWGEKKHIVPAFYRYEHLNI